MARSSIVLVLIATASAVHLPGSFGRRGPTTRASADDGCTFGGLCAGPTGGVYDVHRMVSRRCSVPPLPPRFDLR